MERTYRGITSSNEDDRLFGSEFLEQIVHYLVENYKPEQLFDEDKLDEWAEANGYVKEE